MLARALLILAVLLASALAAAAERRVALVMGMDRYETLRPLDNAVNDARAIADTLEALGFEVFSEVDRDLRRTRRALEDFREDAAGADVALVFFAGHGVEIAGENRLLPTDTDATSLDALKASSLPLEEVREAIAAIAPVGLVLLDACRNDPFGSADAAGRGAAALAPDVAAAARPGFGRVGSAENMLFAFAAAPGATASDGDGDNSPFTSAAMRYLGTDGLEIRSTLTLIQQAVYEETGGTQLPYVESGLPSLFFAAQEGELPERERLLMAMADVTPAIRAEVETVAAAKEMPLAPLYGALLSGGLTGLGPDERNLKLGEAAAAFVKVREELRTLASGDPAVTALRQEAETQLSLGAFAAARGKLADAAALDRNSRLALKANLVERTLSEAATLYLSAGAAQADLKYALAISDYEASASLLDEVGMEALPLDSLGRLVLALTQLGKLHTTTGNLAAAKDAQQRALAAFEFDDRRTGGSAATATNLAIVHIGMGDLASLGGDLAGAAVAYASARQQVERGLALAPGDVILQEYEGKLHDRAGDLAQAKGDLIAAHKEFYEAYLVAQTRARATRDGNAVVDLATMLTKIGSVLLRRGWFDEADKALAGGLDLLRSLAAVNPGHAGVHRDLALTLLSAGRMRFTVGALDIAAANHREALTVLDRIAAADPENLSLQRNIWLALDAIREVELARGDDAAALASAERGRRLVARLAERDPLNAIWQGDLADAQSGLAKVLISTGRAAAALAMLEPALRIRERLSAADPANRDWRHAVHKSHFLLGEARLALGDRAAALQAFRTAYEIVRPLATADLTNEVLQRDTAATRQRIGDLLSGTDAAAAVDEYFQATLILSGMIHSHPESVFDQISMFSLNVRLGELTEYKEAYFGRAIEGLATAEAQGRLPRAWRLKLAETRRLHAEAVAAARK